MGKKFHQKRACLPKRFTLFSRLVLLGMMLGILVSISSGCGIEDTGGTSDPDVVISEEMLDTCQIVLPGCSGEYRFLFLTDLHITLPAEEDGEAVYQYAVERAALFSSEGYDASELLTAWVDYANEQDLDGMLLGGDIIDAPSASNLSFLTETLTDLECSYLYTPGNHDWTFPWEYMTAEGEATYLSALAPLMQESPHFQYLEYEDFIIVAVDNCSNQVHPDVLEPYRELLSRGKPVIVLLHVPLATDTLLTRAKEEWSSPVVLGAGNYGGIYPNETSTAFIELTLAEDSPVVAMFAGHVHFPDTSVLDGETEIVQYTGDAGYKGKGLLIQIVGEEGQAQEKESHEDFSKDELFPIHEIRYTDPQRCGGYGVTEIFLKDGTVRQIDFEALEGRMTL